MISFENDYSTGAHPRVLQKLVETNAEVLTAYGNDLYSARAKEKIRAACACPEAEVFFLAGGTQANALVIDSLLRGFEAVVAAGTGHVCDHEAGAIEATGRKVLALPHKNGKLTAEAVADCAREYRENGNREHMVFPRLVYISHPTEYGTVYSKSELEALSLVCRENGLILYMDGARLGCALASRGTDVTLADIARLCGAFYIGGTKMGALCGEAVVFTKGNAPEHFFTSVKRRGALPAKGRLAGVQFDALFTDGLYLEIGRHSVAMAEELKSVFREKNIRFFMETPTNQQFVVLDNARLAALAEKVRFSVWEKFDETRTVVRFVTSWSTTREELAELRKIL